MLANLLLILATSAALAAAAPLSIQFSSPADNEQISARTLNIELVYIGATTGSSDVLADCTGQLLMDGNKFYDFTPNGNSLSLHLDGVGAYTPGPHKLAAAVTCPSSPAARASVSFIKIGAPEESAGALFDERYIDASLEFLETICGEAAAAAEGRVDLGSQDAGEDGVTVLAIGMPVLSSRVSYDGGKKDNLDEPIERGSWPDASRDLPSLPLFDIFLPSLARGISSSSPVKYVLYFGYDAGDAVFDNEKARESMDDMIGKVMQGLPVEWRWFKYSGMEGKVFWIYEDLFRQAYSDGAHYFFMGNDDLAFETHAWAEALITRLRSSTVHRNFGVAGPVDTRDLHKHHMTFAMFHRSHYEALGFFFPHAFPNWWSDLWSTISYGRPWTHWTNDVRVKNTEKAGRRYPAFWGGQEVLSDEVQATRAKLQDYCQCIIDGGVPRFGACGATQGKWKRN